jgi:L,D-peptidoglycan transpeptidase YkuD (ErfK/YbiS/YcfS/YnhG family)
MDIFVAAPGWLTWRGRSVQCALGRGGIGLKKTEGDGQTPVGCFALREIFYRADRVPTPQSALSARAIAPQDGWCDDPSHPDYNQHVLLPHPARHERLWRDDALYDLLVVLGYNDAPVVPGAGSAIFLHVARPDFAPTEGCVALAPDVLTDLLAACGPGDRLCINAPRR